jgi:hypothetical protein
MSLRAIGRRLGDITVAAFTQNSKRLTAKMKEDVKLKEQFLKLKRYFRE